MNSNKKLMIYKFVLFSLKGHKTWRVADAITFARDVKPDQIMSKKIIEMDRLTGQVTVK